MKGPAAKASMSHTASLAVNDYNGLNSASEVKARGAGIALAPYPGLCTP